MDAPSIQDLEKINKQENLGCNLNELKEFELLLKSSIEDINFIETLKSTDRYVKCERNFKYPKPEENPCNAWYVTCDIQSKKDGKLANKKIAIKDNIAVAFVPMMNGSSIVEGYTPEYDATVVQRILEAGGTIAGKTTCESLCFGGDSFLTKYGPVENPCNREYSAGGSSSGSGAVVALGEADMAIGGDQGGSVRIPASRCGIVGLKPTFGLVPYTGAISIVPCYDHLGPMAKNVADCALLLEVIAGGDNGSDFRQTQNHKHGSILYSKLIYPNIIPQRKLKVAILKEGVSCCIDEVKKVFKTAVDQLNQNELLDITEVSFPRHEEAGKISGIHRYLAIRDCVVEQHGCNIGNNGFQSETLAHHLHQGFKKFSSELPVSLKQAVFFGKYIKEKYGMEKYAKTSSLLTDITLDYNNLLADLDVLIMPTHHDLPVKIPTKPLTVTETIRSGKVKPNLAIFNITGHPVISINCGCHNEFPIGFTIVGKHYHEVDVFNVASICEETFNKQKL